MDYFGAATPLKSLCTVMTPDASTLVLQPFEKSSIGDIEKAILKSDVGEIFLFLGSASYHIFLSFFCVEVLMYIMPKVLMEVIDFIYSCSGESIQ